MFMLYFDCIKSMAMLCIITFLYSQSIYIYIIDYHFKYSAFNGELSTFCYFLCVFSFLGKLQSRCRCRRPEILGYDPSVPHLFSLQQQHSSPSFPAVLVLFQGGNSSKWWLCSSEVFHMFNSSRGWEDGAPNLLHFCLVTADLIQDCVCLPWNPGCLLGNFLEHIRGMRFSQIKSSFFLCLYVLQLSSVAVQIFFHGTAFKQFSLFGTASSDLPRCCGLTNRSNNRF